jgi:hypothetical protein
MTLLPADPPTLDAYNKLFHENSRIEGFGIRGVKQVAPCPFCAAADWAEWLIIQAQEDMQKEATCKNCGRSAKFVFNDEGAGLIFELVQTGAYNSEG